MAEQQFSKHVNIAIDNEGFYWITPIVTTESFNFIAPPFFKTQVAHTDPQTIIDLAFIAMKYCRIITNIITAEDVRIACLLTPITPATIRQITIEDMAGK